MPSEKKIRIFMGEEKKKLSVALVRGPVVFAAGSVNNEATPAIGFAYISGYLRPKGYDTIIVDSIGEGLNIAWPLKNYPGFNCQGLPFDAVIARIPKGTDVIGFSGMFSGEWPVMRDFIVEVRKQFPHALFVIGGEHVSALPEYSLRDCLALDCCIIGEGECTFYSLLESYKETGKFQGVYGIAYIDDQDNFIQNCTKPPRIDNIDEIPWPDWPEGYLEKFWAAEKSYGISSKRDMPFMFSRGCPYQCTFCSNPGMWTTGRYRLRDIDDIIREVKYYIDRYNITSIQLYDLTAIVKKDWIIQFCQRVLKERIKLNWTFPSGTRSEALDVETLSLLKQIGCNYLVYAPESGSPETLKLVKKHIKLERITDSVLEAKKQGLIVRTNLIIGFPGESWRDVFKTLMYGLKMSIKGVDEVPVFIFSPYPGTEIFQNLIRKGKIILNDDYFFSLTSLNSNYLSTKVVSYNPKTNARLLGIFRFIFNMMNYALGYFLHPERILRTFLSLSSSETATVFEHRLKDMLKRKGINKKEEKIDRKIQKKVS